MFGLWAFSETQQQMEGSSREGLWSQVVKERMLLDPHDAIISFSSYRLTLAACCWTQCVRNPIDQKQTKMAEKKGKQFPQLLREMDSNVWTKKKYPEYRIITKKNCFQDKRALAVKDDGEVRKQVRAVYSSMRLLLIAFCILRVNTIVVKTRNQAKTAPNVISTAATLPCGCK